MKRSDMVDLIHEYLFENYPEFEASDLLTILEEKGMLPPAYVNTELGDHMNFYEINQWEEE